jgi:hypothetical protein
MTSRPHVLSNVHRARAGAQTLGQAGAGKPRPRSYGVHNRATPRISAACQRGDCTSCFSLNCTCQLCGHRGVNTI